MCLSGSVRPADELGQACARAEGAGLEALFRTSASAPDAAAVLGALRRYRGLAMAITSENLARHVHLEPRRVRAVIADLIKAGEMIGSSVSGEHLGYFMIQTEQELEMTRAVLRSRAREIFARDAALRRAWERTHGKSLQPFLPELGV